MIRKDWTDEQREIHDMIQDDTLPDFRRLFGKIKDNVETLCLSHDADEYNQNQITRSAQVQVSKIVNAPYTSAQWVSGLLDQLRQDVMNIMSEDMDERRINESRGGISLEKERVRTYQNPATVLERKMTQINRSETTFAIYEGLFEAARTAHDEIFAESWKPMQRGEVRSVPVTELDAAEYLAKKGFDISKIRNKEIAQYVEKTQEEALTAPQPEAEATA